MRSSAGASSSLPGTYARAVRGSSAATRSRCAATNDTELPAAGTNRHLGALPKPAGSKARAGLSSDAVAAPREAVADSDTPMPEAGACAQLAQSQVSEIVDPASEVLDSEKLEHALVDLLGQLLIGCPEYPAARIRQPLFPKLRFGHLDALCNAVESVWDMRRADFPKESSLKPKLYACWWPIYFTRSTAVLGAAARGRRL